MAVTRKNTKETKPAKSAQTNKASFAMIGVIADVYEGKMYNYLTVHVDSDTINPKTSTPYYNTFKVQCSKSMDVVLDDEPVLISGYLTTFFDRTKKALDITFHAVDIKTDITNEPF